MRVGLGGEVEALDRDHDRLGDDVAELRVGEPGGVAGVGEVAERRAGRRASGSCAGSPRSSRASAGRAGRCGRRSRAAPGRRTSRRSRSGCRGPRSRRSTSPPRRRRGWPRRRPVSEMRQVGVGAVGEVGAARPRSSTTRRRRAGEERLDAGRHQPALDPAREVVHDVLRPRVHRRVVAQLVGQLRQQRLGSITTILPASWGPALRIRSSARIALGAPPLTIGCEPGERLERGRAAGAVGGEPDVALEVPQRLPRSPGPKQPSTRPTLKPRSSSRCWRANTSSPASTLPGRWVSTRSPSVQRASSSRGRWSCRRRRRRSGRAAAGRRGPPARRARRRPCRPPGRPRAARSARGAP